MKQRGKEGASLSDEELAVLAASGDRAAAEELARRFYPPLYRFFLKLSHTEYDAADLTQATLLRMIERAHKYRAGPDSRFSSWLFKVAYRLFIDSVRGRRPIPVEAEALEAMPDGADGHERADNRYLVQMLLGALDPQKRTLVVLRYYMDHSYEQIAAETGLSAQQVKWKLHDAMEKLRKEALHEHRGNADRRRRADA